jgi:N,N'-diacetyllegionaminate synthase
MYIVAEIGQAHDGSLGIAHSYIDALAGTGVDAVKFQTHIADAESSYYEPFRVNFSYEDEFRIDYWRRMEFTESQWAGLKDHCKEKGLEFISSPFSCAAVDLLENINVSKYKIGSGEVSNFLLLEKIALTNKPIILSSGMSSFSELDRTIAFLKEFSNPLSILQCTTSYPTQPEQWGLNVIGELKRRYALPVGFSDHSGSISACLAATALGAEILEFHVVFDKRMFGPDAKSSLTIEEIRLLCKGVHEIRISLDNSIDKADNSHFTDLKGIFEKSIAINKDLVKGHKLTVQDLESKKPLGKGINASLYRSILGRSIKRNMKQWDFITEADLENTWE